MIVTSTAKGTGTARERSGDFHRGRGGTLASDPNQAPPLALYGTGGCHLCEQADALVRGAVAAVFRPVEIADDVELLERYGRRIPVLRRLETGEELDWPFDAAAVQRLLEGRGLQP
jgi:hypothetical protein